MALKPGKGLHSYINQEVLDFLMKNLAEVSQFYDDHQADEDSRVIFQALRSGAQPEWNYEDDSFGKKLWIGIPHAQGELRFTIVLSKKGELKLDIRAWYE